MRRSLLLASALGLFGLWLALALHSPSRDEGPELPPEIPQLELRLSSKNLITWGELLRRARATGKREGRWVSGTLRTPEGPKPCKVRLRGDNSHHWEGPQISLRVKLRRGATFRGMRAWDLILPFDRGFYEESLAEWWSERLDLVRCQTGFMSLDLNDHWQGIYVLLECLGKEQLERTGRAEGPIFKSRSDYHFHEPTLRYAYQRDLLYSAPFFQLRDEAAPQAAAARRLLQEVVRPFRDGRLTRDEYRRIAHFVDLERWAAYNSLTRVLGPHAEAPHNITLYFNPASGLFEPVLIDPLSDFTQDEDDFERSDAPHMFSHQLLGLREFRSLRNERLREVHAAGPEFLSFLSRFANLNPVLAADPHQRVNPVRTGDPELDKPEPATLPALDQFGNALHTLYLTRLGWIPPYLAAGDTPAPEPFRQVLKWELPLAHLDVALGEGESALYLRGAPPNRDQGAPLELRELTLRGPGAEEVALIGSARAPQRSASGGEVRFRWAAAEAPRAARGEQIELRLAGLRPEQRCDAEVRVAGQRAQVVTEVSDGRRCSFAFLERSQRAALQAGSDLEVREEPGRLVVPAGDYRVRETLIVPRGKPLHFEPGARLFFAPGTSLISYAPLVARGTAAAPIEFRGRSPGEPWGVVAVVAANARLAASEAPARSELRHVRCFDARGARLNAVAYTGISFLYSDVSLSRCVFVRCGLDDGLNVKRADVQLRECLFVDSPSDAIDLDWCTGEVRDCLLSGSRGDGLDLSGAERLRASGNAIVATGDKAVSVGEASRAHLQSNVYVGSAIGVASKDSSRTLSQQDLYLACDEELAAYRKKPIFQGGLLVASEPHLGRPAPVIHKDEGSKVQVLQARTLAWPDAALARGPLRRAALRSLCASLPAAPASARWRAGSPWGLSEEAWSWAPAE